MPADELYDFLPIRISHPQTPADLLRHGRAALWVAVKVAAACCVNCKGIHLANIVQQHCPAQNRLRRNGRRCISRMGIQVIAVMHIFLVEPHAGQQLRHEHTQHIRIGKQHLSAPRAAQQLIHLHEDALCGDFFQQRRLLVNCLSGGLLHGEIQH